MDVANWIPPISTHDGRRAWAFLAIVGGGMVFTAMVVWSLWILRHNAGFIFWLAICAHIQIFVVMTSLGWAMGRRMLASATRDGVTVDDRAPPNVPPSQDATRGFAHEHPFQPANPAPAPYSPSPNPHGYPYGDPNYPPPSGQYGLAGNPVDQRPFAGPRPDDQA